MTVKKGSRCGGYASIVTRQKLHNNSQLDISSLSKLPAPHSYNVIVGFNEKDQLQLSTKEESNDDDKQKLIKDYDKTVKHENIAIDDIANCVNIDNYSNCENTLVFYIIKSTNKEAIALRFENEQDFKRIYFTYKYFKMRNRLTRNTTTHSSSDNLFSKKKPVESYTIKTIDDYNVYDKTRSEYDLMHTVDNDGVTHISVQQKSLNSRFDQPLSLIGLRHDRDVGEIDSIIYTDIEVASKPEKKRLFQKKTKAPPPPNKETPKILKGEFVRVNVERSPDVIPKESKHNKIPDILVFKDGKSKKNNSNLWSVSNKVNNGYESDREEWRSSRSQFSTTAFDSLARPTKMAMALTLKKPQRLEPVPQYFRLASDSKPKLTPLPFRPNNFLQRTPRLPRPNTEIKQRNFSTDHRKYASLQSLELPKKLSEPKKSDKKTNYTNISHRITGLTNKLRDLSSGNTIGRLKAQSHSDVANLKPVLKIQDGKRSVVRTCSAEPPKKLSYPSGVVAQLGNELAPTNVKDQPNVSYEADPNSYYTLIFTDPDNYDGPEKVYREWHHWLVVNIPGSDVSKGEVLSPYIGSGPPDGTGIHRYVYFLYKQPGKLSFDEKKLTNKSIDGRAAFSTAKFAEKYNLGNPVAGNFYRAQFDDYVPLLYKSLGV
ncbi:unnamed protein product, partial [Brenthis ino]